MALNQDYLGRTYAPTAVYEVGSEKIRQFATAIGDTNPAYHDLAAAQALGYSGLVAPPTFVFVITQAAAQEAIADPGLGLDYSRVVHGDQRFRHARPLVAGDRIRTTVTLDSLRSAAGHDLVTTRCELTDEAGRQVAEAWMTLVARGTAEAGA